MKVVILCPRNPKTHYGGLENLTLKIAEQVAEQGDQVEIYCTSSNPKDSTVGKVKIREFAGFAPSESYYFSWSLYQALKESNADIIHSIAYNNLLTLLGLMAKKPNQKYILSLNLGGEPPLFRRMLYPIYNTIINLFANRIDKVISITKKEEDEFLGKLKVNKKKFTIIQTGIDLEKIKKVKTNKKGNYIISPGRFVKIKNFHHLIPAFAKVSEKFSETKLLLIGSGPLEEELRNRVKELGIQNKVIFEKPVPMNRMHEVHKKIKESKMCVLLTDSGYEGIMGFEAIACGVPVLFADSEGLTESVRNGYAQAVKDPYNHDEIAGKISEILENPEKFTPKNPKILSWNEVTMQTYNVYKDVLKLINSD